MAPTNRADLMVRPLGPTIPDTVPRTISNKIAWDTFKTSVQLTFPTTGIVEINFSFNLASHPQASSWTSLFDQWCIPQASLRFESQYPSSATFPPATLFTALDFDSNSNLGMISAIEDFSTCAETVMSLGKTFVRTIRPCVKPQLGATASSGVGRVWCDSSVTNTPWFCIRALGGSTGTSYTVNITSTVWFAFRNQI